MKAEHEPQMKQQSQVDAVVADGPTVTLPVQTNSAEGKADISTNGTSTKDLANGIVGNGDLVTSTKASAAAADDSTPTSNDTTQNTTVNSAETKSKPPLLCLGMARTGTASLGEALRQLGVGKVHHGIDMQVPDDEWQWQIFNKAADAAFPDRSFYRGTPFAREEWDEWCSHFDAITDIASFYAVSLIKAYPDAKVILVERDIESWLKSIWIIFKQWEAPAAKFLYESVAPRTSSIAGTASMKFQLGWSETEDIKKIWPNARKSYERHYRDVRSMVPPEQLLEFKLKDGWGPLCEFLGKKEPAGSFPHINETAAYEKHAKKQARIAFKSLGKNILKLNLKKRTA